MKSLIDLNSILLRCHTSASLRKETADEHRTDDLRSTNGLPADTRVSILRRTLQRQLQDQELILLGRVPVHGLRPADLPGEPAEHPGLSALGQPEALPQGHPRKRLPQYSGSRQTNTRLAHLRRLRPRTHRPGPPTQRWRRIRNRTWLERLCPGCHNDRPVPVAVPLGLSLSVQ